MYIHIYRVGFARKRGGVRGISPFLLYIPPPLLIYIYGDKMNKATSTTDHIKYTKETFLN